MSQKRCKHCAISMKNAPDLYVIAADSLLESLMGRHISFPVGRVEYMALHPCTFVEFLIAIGDGALAEQVQKLSVPQSLHKYALDLFKKYMIVGGLPEAIANYAKHRDLVKLNDVFNAMLAGYRDDIEKYASKPKEQDAIRYHTQLWLDVCRAQNTICKIHQFQFQVDRCQQRL